MAEIGYSVTSLPDGGTLYTWENVTESDTFQAASILRAVSDISAHVTGTFGGATVTIKGGNVSSEVLDLTQLGGAAAAATAADLFSILDRPIYIQPVAASGSSQSVDVYITVRK